MGKIIIFIIGLCLIFGVNVSARSFTKDVNLIDIIVFENFEYKELKDDFLKQVGIDVNYITIFNKKIFIFVIKITYSVILITNLLYH